MSDSHILAAKSAGRPLFSAAPGALTSSQYSLLPPPADLVMMGRGPILNLALGRVRQQVFCFRAGLRAFLGLDLIQLRTVTD